MLSILLAHNYYRSSSPSGENVAFEAEVGLLREKGHTVYEYVRRSDDIADFSLAQRAALSAQIIWSHRSYVDVKRQLTKQRPDVAHFHNIFPLISVSALRACSESNVPALVTLHNYRAMCLNAQLVRESSVCESCLGRRVAWPGVLHRCYRGSLRHSAVMAAMLFGNRMIGTWSKDVALFLAPSAFLRDKYVAAGFPADRISVKPNFIDFDPGSRSEDREYALFVGRLSSEKGVGTLLAAWKTLPHIPLIILGDGPERETLRASAMQLRNVRFLGAVEHREVLGFVRRARYLVVASEWYENLPMVMLEAFACGTPVIASNLGGLAEVIAIGRNGLLFRPKDPSDLAVKADYLWSHPEHASVLGRGARSDYEVRFSAERNYEQLLGAYAKALQRHSKDSACFDKSHNYQSNDPTPWSS